MRKANPPIMLLTLKKNIGLEPLIRLQNSRVVSNIGSEALLWIEFKLLKGWVELQCSSITRVA